MKTMTLPERIYATAVRVTLVKEEEREEEYGVPARAVVTAFAVDLDFVVGVREGCAFAGELDPDGFKRDADGIVTDECVIDCASGETITLLAPYADVLSAWQAWRRYADARPLSLHN